MDGLYVFGTLITFRLRPPQDPNEASKLVKKLEYDTEIFVRKVKLTDDDLTALGIK